MPEPEPQSQPTNPIDPAHQPAPAAGASSVMPGGKSAAQKTQPAPLRGAIEIKPIETRPAMPARSAPNPPNPDIQGLPEVATGEGSSSALAKPASLNFVKAKPEETADKTSSAPGQVWTVQVASYARETDARGFAARLKDKGYNVNVVSGEVAGRARYRVEIGPLANRSDAQSIQKELATVYKLDQALLLTRPVNSKSSAQAR
jgi:cell division septation protein DedD